MTDWFIALHIGAGHHSLKKEERYRTTLHRALQHGQSMIQNVYTMIDDVAQQVAMVLENDPMTNAGIGSNLNLEGVVECDACFMSMKREDRRPLYAAVGAVKGIENPVQVARSLIDNQRDPRSRLLGRIPPMILVGRGAYDYALEKNLSTFETFDNSPMMTIEAFQKYENEKTRLHDITMNEEGSSDTIGVIVYHPDQGMVVACSSGGISLKLPGRVGQVAHYGGGCWIQQNDDFITANCTTGTGEQLIESVLAKSCGEYVLQSDSNFVYSIRQCMEKEFLDVFNEESSGGILAVKVDKRNERMELAWSHSTPSMALGYWHGKKKSCKTWISRKKNTSLCHSEAISL